jgi:hypothetical protein
MGATAEIRKACMESSLGKERRARKRRHLSHYRSILVNLQNTDAVAVIGQSLVFSLLSFLKENSRLMISPSCLCIFLYRLLNRLVDAMKFSRKVMPLTVTSMA